MVDILKMPYVAKVLPLVYDESLSYYELLCKVVKKLNDTITELNDQGEDVAQLKAEMAEVKYWIEHFDVEGFARLTGADFLGDVTTTGSMSAVQGFTGDLTGNVTGDVTGNVHGNVTGDVTGDLTGNVVGNVRGNVTGILTGSVNGDVNGNVRGNVTGNVAGNVTGTLTGDSHGTHYGGVVGNVTGDVTGDVTGNVTGNAGSADVLSTPRDIMVDLEADSSEAFDGSDNVDVGVKGVLPVEHGGTGSDSFDSAPTAGSTKPVTSGGIKTALDAKQGTLTFDVAPTQGSTNPVTSDGIYNAISQAGVGVVSSVFGRTGVIVASQGDYDAELIDYDGTTSGLVSTDVQGAIDELASRATTASDVSLSTTGTSLPSNVNTVQKLAEYMYPPTVTVTLTINGAKEDTITIYNSDNELVATCVFETGQTSGSCQIVVDNAGGTYKFVSGVAKDIVTGASDFEVTKTLTNQSAQTVNVYPDHALYWYGNEIVPWVTSGYTNGSQNCYGGVKNTNDMYVAQTYDLSGIATYVGTDNAVDLSGYNTIKMSSKANAFATYSSALGINTAKDLGGGAYSYAKIQTGSDTSYHIGSADISNVSTTNYIFFTAGGNVRSGYCNAVWLE